MTRDDLAAYLEKAAADVLEVSKGESVEIRTGALVVYGLLSVGAILARRGLDPVTHITRLVDIDAGLTAVENEVDAAADKKFGGEFGGMDQSPGIAPVPPSPVEPGGSGTPTT